ncbi:hypothetical protein HMPREF9383_1548 [Streptococcus sanguinis SK150]|uniref:Uncharacterized protein n=1 Tax=Streptococcus sanguinis SK150 TaxID=888811 RepID=F0IN45_STRSA|nr:hypothetical protein HMPREF9383_1548 [Streptococcus sanguinis SK150]
MITFPTDFQFRILLVSSTSLLASSNKLAIIGSKAKLQINYDLNRFSKSINQNPQSHDWGIVH